jgi:hypothetical protein
MWIKKLEENGWVWQVFSKFLALFSHLSLEEFLLKMQSPTWAQMGM